MEEENEFAIPPLPGNLDLEVDLANLRNISDPRVFRSIMRRRLYNNYYFRDMMIRLAYLINPELEHLFVDNPASLTVLKILLNAQFRPFIDGVILEGGPPAAG